MLITQVFVEIASRDVVLAAANAAVKKKKLDGCVRNAIVRRSGFANGKLRMNVDRVEYSEKDEVQLRD